MMKCIAFVSSILVNELVLVSCKESKSKGGL